MVILIGFQDNACNFKNLLSHICQPSPYPFHTSSIHCKKRFQRLNRQYIKGIGFELNKICQWQQKMKLGPNRGQQLEHCKGMTRVIASYK